MASVTLHSNPGKCVWGPRYCTQFPEPRLYLKPGQSGLERTRDTAWIGEWCGRERRRSVAEGWKATRCWGERDSGTPAAIRGCVSRCRATPQAASPAVSHCCHFCIQIPDKLRSEHRPRFEYKRPGFQCNDFAVKDRKILESQGSPIRKLSAARQQLDRRGSGCYFFNNLDTNTRSKLSHYILNV
jgi:hypothetical protein